MKKVILLLIVLCMCRVSWAQQSLEEQTADLNNAYALNKQDKNYPSAEQEDDAVRVRNISKTFPADRSDKINLSNQFGSMVIKVWDRKEVKIDISIRVSSSNEKRAQEFLEQVNIEAEKRGDLISCKTEIDRDNNWLNRNKKGDIKVNYVAYVPASNALNLNQQFGNINMADFSGPLSVKVQYGNLVAGKLLDDNNYISVQYGKADIQELNKATIKQQYGSGLTIGSVAELNLSAQYATVDITTIRGNAVIKQQYGSGLKIGSVNNLDLNVQYAEVEIGNIRGEATIKQQYNSIRIASVGKLAIKAQYAGVTVGTLKGDGDVSVSYNQFNLSELGAACKNLTISSAYANVSLSVANSFNGEFNIQKQYGGFKYSPEYKVRLIDDSDDEGRSSTKTYVGRIGNGGNSNISIKASYGNISLR